MPEAPRLILASGSAARKSMLEAAGLVFDVIPADVDEAAIRELMMTKNPRAAPVEIATELAAEKARQVSRMHPHALIVGADQVLACNGRIFSKAESLSGAREILESLRGRTHELVSAVALARGGAVLWQATDTAAMTMRGFSAEFLRSYLEKQRDQVLRSVGCYELEALGVQLFERIDGDYFTILGLPLLPLLARLRQEDMVPA